MAENTKTTTEGTVEKMTRINGHDARIDDAPSRGYSRGIAATGFRRFIARHGDDIDPDDVGTFVRYETGGIALKLRHDDMTLIGTIEAPEGWSLDRVHNTGINTYIHFRGVDQ